MSPGETAKTPTVVTPRSVASRWRALPLAVLVYAVSVVTGAGLLALVLALDYRATLHNAEHDAVGEAALLAPRIESTLNRVDSTLALLTDQFRDGQWPTPKLGAGGIVPSTTFEVLAQSFPEIDSIIVFNHEGELEATSVWRPADFNARGRLYFVDAKRRPTRETRYVTDVSKFTGMPTLFAYRSIVDSKGTFRGVAMIPLHLPYFADLFARAEVAQQGSISWRFAGDGRLVLRSPPPPPSAPLVAPSYVPNLSLAKDGVYALTSADDDVERIYGYAGVNGHPFYLTAGLARSEVFERWRLLAILSSLAMLTIFSMGGVLLARYQRSESARKRSERLYRSMVESQSDLVCRLLQDTTLTYHNSEYGRRLVPPGQTVVGKRLSDFLVRDAGTVLEERVARAIADGASEDRDWLDCVDGTRRCYHWHLTRLPTVVGESVEVQAVGRDITALLEAERQVVESEHHYMTLANSGSALIWTTDTQKKCTYVNEPWLRFTGQTGAVDFGAVWMDCIYPDDKDECARVYESSFDSRKPFALTYRAKRSDGSVRWLRDEATPRFDTHGTFLGYVGHCIDITEEVETNRKLADYRDHLEDQVRQRTAELSAATVRAEAANHAKSVFLANMSHELRTPLNAILGMGYLLRRQESNPDKVRRLEQLDLAGKHLLEVIEGVLELSKIEAGKVRLRSEPVDIGDVISQAVSLVEQRTAEKGLSIHVVLPEQSTAHVGDALRLRQALVNYVANAVKFTDAGSVTIRVTETQVELDADLLRFEVEDTGIGIDHKDLTRLFAAFEQADNSPTRRHGGTGLGLAITKRLAQLMGGSAGATSQPGHGSVFWFTARLGRAVGGQGSKALASPEPTEASLRSLAAGKRVLVAEDEPVSLEVCCELLTSVGLHVDAATNGLDAVRAAEASTFDLVLLDIRMPGLSGIQVALTMRLLPGYERIPIIALTANAYTEDRAQCIAAGMDDFLAKPYVPEQLFSVLARWLRRGPA